MAGALPRLLLAAVAIAATVLGSAGNPHMTHTGHHTAHGNHTAHGHGHGTRHTLLEPCKAILQNMTSEQANAIRDALQVLGQHKRKYFNWHVFADHLKHPPTKDQFPEAGRLESVNFAFKTNYSLHDLESFARKESNVLMAVENRLRHQVEQLKQSGAVNAAVSEMDIKKCVYGRVNTHLFEYRPKVSFMMQYFKRPHIIQPFIQRLQESCGAIMPIELVVNVDNPADHEAWATSSYSTNGMVVPVFSNNLHEVRAYNRLAHIARGDILIMVADDDLFPKDCSWLSRVLSIFEKYADVGVVGIRNYVRCFTHENNRGNWYKDAQLGINMQFVHRVDMAPLALRKAAYMYVGGMDETLTEPGECGIISDWEICHRMWISGWQVVATDQVPMEHDTKAEAGTHTPQNAHRCWGKQQGLVGRVMETRTDRGLEEAMCEAARKANIQHLELIDPAKCPYEKETCKL